MIWQHLLFAGAGGFGLWAIADSVRAMRRAAAALPGFAPSLASQSRPYRAAATIAGEIAW